MKLKLMPARGYGVELSIWRAYIRCTLYIREKQMQKNIWLCSGSLLKKRERGVASNQRQSERAAVKRREKGCALIEEERASGVGHTRSRRRRDSSGPREKKELRMLAGGWWSVDAVSTGTEQDGDARGKETRKGRTRRLRAVDHPPCLGGSLLSLSQVLSTHQLLPSAIRNSTSLLLHTFCSLYLLVSLYLHWALLFSLIVSLEVQLTLFFR